MAEIQAQESFEAPADNIVPFPSTTATDAIGNDGQIKLYTADELKQVFAPDAQTSRTIRDLVAKVREAYHWLEEIEFKRGDKFTQFTFDQIKAMKESGLTQKQWIAEIQKLFPQPEIQQPQEVEPPQSSQLAGVEVVEDEPTVSAIARVRENRYYVPDSGSNRLARAQETRQSQRFNLNDTRQRVQQAFLGLAVQTHENQQAKEIEREADKEQTFEEAYADELERIQIENAAREAARADYAAFQEQVRMGNVPAPTASSASV
jgi:uncharacterized protein YukE